MRLALKDIGSVDSPTQPTTNNFVTVTRYRVVYRRSDGRNTPGWTCRTRSMGRHLHRWHCCRHVRLHDRSRTGEARGAAAGPAGGGRALLISTLADVTFYGRDQVGNEVT